MNGPNSPGRDNPDICLATPSPIKTIPLNTTAGTAPPSKSDKQTGTLLTRSNSMRSKGINFNLAISPISTNSTPPSQTKNRKRTGSNDFRNSQLLPQLAEVSPNSSAPDSPIPSASEGLKYDLPLPPTENLIGLDIDEQLRLLALKEMSIVEIKDGISNLTSKLERNENELHNLREVIQKSLYKELSTSNTKPDDLSQTKRRPHRQNSNPREEAIASTRNKSRRRTLSTSSAKDNSVLPQQETQILPESSNGLNSKLWSNLSKPLNLIQQFDSIIQNEFEKSLMPNQNQELSTRRGSTSHKSRLSEDSISSVNSIPSPLKSKSDTYLNEKQVDLERYLAPVDQTRQAKINTDRHSDDMLQAVSSSIWSFVNDVKSNVLASLGEEADQEPGVTNSSKFPTEDSEVKDVTDGLTVYNLDNGSTVSLYENENLLNDGDTDFESKSNV